MYIVQPRTQAECNQLISLLDTNGYECEYLYKQVKKVTVNTEVIFWRNSTVLSNTCYVKRQGYAELEFQITPRHYITANQVQQAINGEL